MAITDVQAAAFRAMLAGDGAEHLRLIEELELTGGGYGYAALVIAGFDAAVRRWLGAADNGGIVTFVGSVRARHGEIGVRLDPRAAERLIRAARPGAPADDFDGLDGTAVTEAQGVLLATLVADARLDAPALDDFVAGVRAEAGEIATAMAEEPDPPPVVSGPVRYRPILEHGVVVGYLWAAGEKTDFLLRPGTGAAGERLRAYWLSWLAFARERGHTATEALLPWHPSDPPRLGTPALGPATELPSVTALHRLAHGLAEPGDYPDTADGPVRHYPVTRAGRFAGHLWASVDDTAAGFLAVPGDEAAARVWRDRLTEAYTSGLTPLQALDAHLDRPETSEAGVVDGPLDQSRTLAELHP